MVIHPVVVEIDVGPMDLPTNSAIRLPQRKKTEKSIMHKTEWKSETEQHIKNDERKVKCIWLRRILKYT